jgi:hypothetical protein
MVCIIIVRWISTLLLSHKPTHHYRPTSVCLQERFVLPISVDLLADMGPSLVVSEA